MKSLYAADDGLLLERERRRGLTMRERQSSVPLERDDRGLLRTDRIGHGDDCACARDVPFANGVVRPQILLAAMFPGSISTYILTISLLVSVSKIFRGKLGVQST